MKKIIAIVCAAAMLSLAACHKDKNEPNNNAEEPQREGVYNPSAKISAVHYSDSSREDEVWMWEGNQLVAVEPGVDFTYSNGRVSTIYMSLMGVGAEVELNYGSDKLIYAAPIHVMGMEATTVQVRHNSQKKVDRLSFELDNMMMNAVLQLLMDFINSDSNGGILPFLHPAPASKATIDSNLTKVDILWTGENATRALINAKINMTTTLNELPRELIESQLGETITELALAMIGDTPLPVTLSIADTIDYTYDDHNNPLKGYLGAIDISALSNNNVETSNNHGAASITANISVFGSSYPLSYSYPIEIGYTSYTFQYNSNGYPTRKTDQDGNITEYTYLGN